MREWSVEKQGSDLEKAADLGVVIFMSTPAVMTERRKSTVPSFKKMCDLDLL